MDHDRRKKEVSHGMSDFKSRYSVNGRDKAAQCIKPLDNYIGWESGEMEDGPERLRSQESDLTKEERMVLDMELSPHGPGLDVLNVSDTKDIHRRKSDVRPLPKAASTLLTKQPRRKSTSEVTIEHHYCRNNSNLQPSLAAWRNNENAAKSNHAGLIGDSETHTVPHLPHLSRRDTLQLSNQPEPVNREESMNIRLNNDHRKYGAYTENVMGKKGLDNQNFTNRQRLPVHSKLTRGRSFSDSDLEDSFMTAEQKEELERLKQHIYETNSRRKCSKKINGRKSDLSSNGCTGKHSTTEGIIFPVLTKKSLKRHSKSHEMVNWSTAPRSLVLLTNGMDTKKTISSKARASVTKDPNLHVDSADYMIETDFSESGTLMNGESNELSIMPSATVHSSENLKKQDLTNRLYFPTPPTSEDGDFSDSFPGVRDRLRARSEPGDVGSRRTFPNFKQFQSRERSESDALKAKVQSFIEKPLPNLPHTTLRVKKSSNEANAKSGYFKMGSGANIAPEPRRRKEGVINIHTCPNLNLYSDRSWMYQGKSSKKHRYIRGPATPAPPVESVFSEDNYKHGSS